MKAAVIEAPGAAPTYSEFGEPEARADEVIITVRAAALSQFSKSRSTGQHYSSDQGFPCIAGADGVGTTPEGKRVYFVLPDAPYGTLAERCPIDRKRCVEIPDALDDITAAAIANPGMSAWTALVERAAMVKGETVLVNGATGTAGRLAVQLAKYLGAGKVIATARNVAELEALKQIGADVVIPFALDAQYSAGAKEFENALKQEFALGINVVIDYLWGESAKTIIVAIAKAVEDSTPVRFVHVGGASREENIELPGAALRSSAIVLMGSGIKSVPMSVLKNSIHEIFHAVQPAALHIATKVVPLASVHDVWESAAGKPRVVFTTA